MERRIVLGKMLNLRDLGGYPAAEGRTTRWGVLLRGDNPMGLSDGDAAWLLGHGFTTIIDLRSPAEQEFLPDELANRPGFSYHFIPMSGGEKLPNEEELIGLGYFRTLERKEIVREVLETIADAPGGVLFHCMAGKDRTGCIAALLLTLAGVDRLDILALLQAGIPGGLPGPTGGGLRLRDKLPACRRTHRGHAEQAERQAVGGITIGFFE